MQTFVLVNVHLSLIELNIVPLGIILCPLFDLYVGVFQYSCANHVSFSQVLVRSNKEWVFILD